ncbi:DUF1385 domain-containing protein [Fusibacter sp. JL216-2]|uniref:DUF1385 domain-containing protein n=1 Tax=Fusibacter sp. JL216-2 TaxID=3071453 RepID=UPI003D334850
MKDKYTSIGGQALIEGVMMRNGAKVAMAVRKSNGEIELKQETHASKFAGISKIPFLRGIFALIASMSVGVKALTWSAEFFEDGTETEPESKFEVWMRDKFGKKADDILIGLSMAFAVVMAFGLFGALPTLIISLTKRWVSDPLILSSMEGVMKIVMFIGYVAAISLMPDIKRVFQYHGAEHKVIYTYESGDALTVENARKYTRLHPRCGTSFLLLVLITSIIIFSFVSWTSPIMRIGMKILFFPLIAGLSFEIIKFTGKHDNALVRIITWPGLMVQNLTTKEPDDSQLEVAIASLKGVLDETEEVVS